MIIYEEMFTIVSSYLNDDHVAFDIAFDIAFDMNSSFLLSSLWKWHG